MSADGALAAWQSRDARAGKTTFAYIDPPVMIQRQHRSSTCREFSWSTAAKSTSCKKYTTKEKQTQRPIAKRALSTMRKRIGASGGMIGGKRNAAGGSTEEMVTKKIAKMRDFHRAHGAWPSKSVSASRWKVSTKLWARARREHAT